MYVYTSLAFTTTEKKGPKEKEKRKKRMYSSPRKKGTNADATTVAVGIEKGLQEVKAVMKIVECLTTAHRHH